MAGTPYKLITSVRNSHVLLARKLAKRGLRDKAGLFLVEGVRGIREAFSAGAEIESVFVQPSAVDTVELGTPPRGVQLLEVSDVVMRSISGATTPPGAVAVARYLDVDAGILIERQASLVVVLVDIRDPGNLGTILRSAWGAGAHSLYLVKGTVDVYNPKVVRSSAGALFNLPFAREVELPWLLSALGDKQMHRIAADPRGSVAYYEVDYSDPTALIFGGEAMGIPKDIDSYLDTRAQVPMPGGAESLNVGITAALFLFEAARQRRS